MAENKGFLGAFKEIYTNARTRKHVEKIKPLFSKPAIARHTKQGF